MITNLTAKEVAALHEIFNSDYQDSSSLSEIIGNPVWSNADTKSEGGVYSSLIKKGMIGADGKGRNATVWITEAARETVEALIASDWNVAPVAAVATPAETLEPTPEAVALITEAAAVQTEEVLASLTDGAPIFVMDAGRKVAARFEKNSPNVDGFVARVGGEAALYRAEDFAGIDEVTTAWVKEKTRPINLNISIRQREEEPAAEEAVDMAPASGPNAPKYLNGLPYEVTARLNNICSNGEGGGEEELTLALAISEAEYVLELIAESGTSLNEELTGSDAEARKSVQTTRRKIKAWLKKAEPKLAEAASVVEFGLKFEAEGAIMEVGPVENGVVKFRDGNLAPSSIMQLQTADFVSRFCNALMQVASPGMWKYEIEPKGGGSKCFDSMISANSFAHAKEIVKTAAARLRSNKVKLSGNAWLLRLEGIELPLSV